MAKTPRRALIVIDVQNEYVTGNMPIEYPPIETSLTNIALAMDAAQAADVPVIVVQHDAPEGSPVFAKGSHGWRLHPTVADRPAAHRVNKTMGSAFAKTDLGEWLTAHAIDTVTIAGYMTHHCDASTTLHAAHNGWKVELLSDATGSLPYDNAGGRASAEEIHRVFCTVFHSGFAAVMTTKDWVAAVREGRPTAPDNIFVSNQRARGLSTPA